MFTWGFEFRTQLFSQEFDTQGAVTHFLWFPTPQAPSVDENLNYSWNQVLKKLRGKRKKANVKVSGEQGVK